VRLLFDGWSGLLRVAVVGVAAYLALVAILRVSGKRTLSKMNAFDLVVTVALGSTLATVLLANDVALAEGVLALALLAALQYAVTWTSIRSRRVRRWVKASPTLLVHRGEVLADAARAVRVSEDEIEAALRQAGLASIREAAAVVLETDGSISVVPAASGRRADQPLDAGFRSRPAESDRAPAGR
jgi:uncharacterized membrane protein YcaP (DUF421 family)